MKQKRYLSRREKTVRRIEALLLLLALFAVSGIYSVLPSHAIREAETSVDCGSTRVIRKLGSAGLQDDGLNRMYISANEKALLFTFAEFSLLEGWQMNAATAVDCTKERPLHVGLGAAVVIWTEELPDGATDLPEEEFLEAVNDSYKSERVIYVYGRVDALEAATVRVRVCRKNSNDWETIYSQDIPRKDWFWAEGRLCFVEEICRGTEWFVDSSLYKGYETDIFVELLDNAGNVLYLEESMSSVTAAYRSY